MTRSAHEAAATTTAGGERARTAAAAALHRLRHDPRPAPARRPLLPLADEAWFYAMLLERHFAQCPDDVPQWQSALDALLDQARGQDPAAALHDRHPADPYARGEELLGAAMLAHLLRIRHPGEPAAERFVARTLMSFGPPAPPVTGLAPLHALCLAHNLGELDEHALARALRPPRDATEAATGLTGAERLLTQAYFHTHLVLFAFGTFRRPEADPAPLADSLAFLRRHARTFERFGWADLCAETALCLSLCGERDEDFHRLLATLHHLQRPEGDWRHPRIDERQARHSTMMAALALLEAARPADTAATPATAGHG
ncbi:hypothetical protein [Streptomyces sp. NPDC088254]|uniref:hypothetical protein n=1 Tax=Streptomyces sp. NPDC088254 TaxID=3365847 RepID=UPI003824E171